MDGLGRAAGSGTTIKLPVLDERGQPVLDEAGKPREETYEMSPLDLDDYGLIENHILAQRPTPDGTLRPLLAGLDGEQQKMLLEIAYADLKKGYNKVSRREVGDWVDTTEGIIFTFWLCLRKKQPAIDSRDKAAAIYARLTREAQSEVMRKRELASGTDLLGNSTGRSQAVAPASSISHSHGSASSAT
jgi:hypothetical protein